MFEGVGALRGAAGSSCRSYRSPGAVLGLLGPVGVQGIGALWGYRVVPPGVTAPLGPSPGPRLVRASGVRAASGAV